MPAATDFQLDLLAVAAHPDDAELFCGGTLALAALRGWRVGIVDLTRGESASLGTPELRANEAAEAARILGLAHREALGLPDGQLENSTEQRTLVVAALRRLRPRIVLTHGDSDRHPDHIAAHALVRDAIFFARVSGWGGLPPGTALHIEALAYFYGNTFQPDPRADWVVDVSEAIPKKYAALEAYHSQFRIDPTSGAPTTYIGSPAYWDHIDRRALEWGHLIGASHGEPFRFTTPAHAGHPLAKLG